MTPIPTCIFRIIDLNNVPEILKDGYIYCCNQLDKIGKKYKSIAYESIMDRRRRIIVPCGPGGNLLDYVAFYFAPLSPMLYTIKMGNVDSNDGDQERIIYIVSTAQKVTKENLDFVFTDGHGIMAYTSFFNDLSDIEKIDWPLMNQRYWYDTVNDLDRKRRRQAEFLVYKKFPWSLVDVIAVLTVQTKNHVESMLTDYGYKTQVEVKPDWYY